MPAPKITISKLSFWLLMLLGTAMAWLPVDNPALIPNHADKLNHLGAFTVLTLAMFWAYALPLKRVALLMLGYGLLIETVQYLLPYRHYSLADMAANAFGILLGLGLILGGRRLLAMFGDKPGI